MVRILRRLIISLFFSIGDKDQDGWPEHDYESGLAGAIKGVWEDGEDMYTSNSLLLISGIVLDEKFQRNASKFAIFHIYIYENLKFHFPFFISCYFQ